MDALFGARHVHGVVGVSFYPRSLAITPGWPAAATPVTAAPLSFPTVH
jgi:hypothetical protein